MPRLRTAAAVLAAATLAGPLALAAAGPAWAADPGRWQEVSHDDVPLYDYQGVAHDPSGRFYFDGVDFGLYRTGPDLTEQARNDDVIPPAVTATEGYNHIGDIDYDSAEGGRVLLPLECYYYQAGNTCKTGAFGVADPETLQWRYYVKLDPAEIPKAMFVAESPDGLLWTSVGRDLLAYRASEVTPANAAPAGPVLHAVRRLAGAVPPGGITGAAFVGDRMLVAGSVGDTFTVTSIDLTTGAGRLEIERQVVGESEGLDVSPALGGTLHWLIQPYNTETLPTYGVDHGTLLTFAPVAPDATVPEVPAAVLLLLGGVAVGGAALRRAAVRAR